MGGRYPAFQRHLTIANLRIFRRVRVAPGLTMNLSKLGPSVSLGVRGGHLDPPPSVRLRIYAAVRTRWSRSSHTAKPWDAIPGLGPGRGSWHCYPSVPPVRVGITWQVLLAPVHNRQVVASLAEYVFFTARPTLSCTRRPSAS